MARFCGVVGYATDEPEEVSPGVYVEKMVERQYRGDVNRVVRKYDTPDNVNGSLSLNHEISIVADAYALDHFFNIRYVEWAGVKWFVATVEVARPRLKLYIGKEYKDEN